MHFRKDTDFLEVKPIQLATINSVFYLIALNVTIIIVISKISPISTAIFWCDGLILNFGTAIVR